MAVRTGEIDPDTLTDGRLAERAARGDRDAFETLYRRHAEAAWRVGQVVAGNPHDAADAVSEAFTRLLSGMGEGRIDPNVPFRSYLLATTRNAAIDTHRRRARLEPVDIDLTDAALDRTAAPHDAVVGDVDAEFVATAFRSLPERWRSVLWLTEVEGMAPREAAEQLGLSANGASQLAVRARNGLRERYLQAHLADAGHADCQDAIAQLGAYAAGTLGPRGAAKVDRHLASCAECQTRLDEVRDVESGLRRIALPLPLALAPAVRHQLEHAGMRAGGLLVGGARGAQAYARLARPLANATAALFAVGVIAAAVIGGNEGAGAGPTVTGVPGELAPANGRAGGLLAPAVTHIGFVAAPAAVVGSVSPVGGVGSAPGGGTGSGSSGGGAGSGGSGSAGPGGTVGSGANGSNGGSGKAPAAGSGSPGSPLVQIAAGANLSATTISVAVGSGPGSCNGVSVAGSPSCAPPAPAQPGVTISLTTPLGPATTAARRAPVRLAVVGR